MLEVRFKDVMDLTPTEYMACYKANYGDGGFMQQELVGCREPTSVRTGKVYLLWDGPDDKQTSLVGWCLITPIRSWGILAASKWNRKRSKHTVQFWVKRNHRKKGYGKLLMDLATRYEPVPHVFPHSKNSSRLFKDYDVTASANDRAWVRWAKADKKWQQRNAA
jgi:hypothetical protein